MDKREEARRLRLVAEQVRDYAANDLCLAREYEERAADLERQAKEESRAIQQ